MIDMNLSPDWEDVFISPQSARHWSRIGSPDALVEEICEWARENKHVILTNDLDFGAILAASRLNAPSVFQIRSHILDPRIVGETVATCVASFDAELERGALISFDLENARVRSLPI